MRSLALSLLSLLALLSCADDIPQTWDCGESCVDGCAFLSAAKHGQCVNDCAVCDDHDSTAFTRPPPDAGPSAWSGDAAVCDGSGHR